MEFEKYFVLNEESKNRTFSTQEEIDDYIEKKIEEVLGNTDKPDEKKDSGKYLVVPVSRGRNAIVDLNAGGAIHAHIELPEGASMISVPVTYGDEVAYGAQMEGTEDTPGAIMGFIHELPSGNIKDTFRVGSPRPGMKFRQVMGAEKIESDDPLPVDPQEEPEDIQTDQDIESAEKEVEELDVEINEIESQLTTEFDPAVIQQLRDRLAQAKEDRDIIQQNLDDMGKRIRANEPRAAIPRTTSFGPGTDIGGDPDDSALAPIPSTTSFR